MWSRLISSGLLAAFVLSSSLNAEEKPVPQNEITKVDYNRDIRPILSQNCFTCHGPDEEQRAADLRLDIPEGAYQLLGDHPAVHAGHPETSLLVQRITTKEPDELMPPVESDLSLTAREIELLTNWIRQGGEYENHWSFQPITRPDLPKVTRTNWPQNEIDLFVLKRLEEVGVTPSPEADRNTLIRRLYLDLTGIPPTPEQIDQFLSDQTPQAYERLVDQALASRHYGEKWGKHWLDQARYADTNGYTIDSTRTMWPYRDWVINALNNDMPFDQFTIEQLAGDLLENPSRDQLVATGFHRNTLINQEGGTDDEQFRNEAVVDRVNTTGAVWLGLTVGCAQCHHHKYDPVTQEDYYQLFAFFNQGEDVNSTSPTLQLTTPEQKTKLEEIEKQINAAKGKLDEYNKLHPPAKQKDGQEKPPVDSQRKKLANAVKKLESAKKSLLSQIPATMIMRDRKEPRETHVLIRGDFLRQGDQVAAGTLSALPTLSDIGIQIEKERPATRLALAKWLVSPQNPLTARVTVNRVWMKYFGTGLVETENDFGMQGTLPTHPDLLDWLAIDFMEAGWSLKQLHRKIVLSATYRQSSHHRQELEELDPLNKLLARQVRIRVDAEQVRDIALAASGLLSHKIGGPSVYPPQPEGVYSFTQRAAKWPTSEGEDRYRRGMYTFFMRSAPYPMLTTFDTPRFNTTCTRRTRSNTPLQSLTMANDETMLEFAQAMGKRILKENVSTDEQRIDYAYRLCFARAPAPWEREQVQEFLTAQRKEFTENSTAATEFSGEGFPEEILPAEAASWTAVARALMNLDEFITRE